MAAKPPFKSVVKGGKYYHVYTGAGGKKTTRYVRKAGGQPGTSGNTLAQVSGINVTPDLLNAIGLGNLKSSDTKGLFSAAGQLAGLKINPQEQAIDQSIQKATGAQQYLSDRMAKYSDLYRGQANAAAQQAAAANKPPALAAPSGNASVDAALTNSLASRSQGFAANSALAAQVAPMRAQDQQSQLAQQFQSQLNDLQAQRTQVEQQRGPETLSAMMTLGQNASASQQKQIENQIAAQGMGLKLDQAQETARHNAASEQTANRRITVTAREANARLTSQERQTRQRLQAQAQQGALNRAQKDRLAQLNARASGKGGPHLTTAQQNTGIGQLANLKHFATLARHGMPFMPGHSKQRPLSREAAAQKIRTSPGGNKIADQALLGAALDAAYDGHISPATQRRLADAGYDPNRVARELGVPIRTGPVRSGGGSPRNPRGALG